MKLIVFADEEVGEKILAFLLHSYLDDIAAVVVTEENRIYCQAKEAGLPTLIYQNSDKLYRQIKGFNKSYDLGLLIWWPKIIKEPLIGLPVNGFVNFHPSLLPYNRGKHYNFWALVEEAPFGVTLHFVDKGVDTGDIIAQKEVLYDWTDTGETLYRKALAAIIELFCENYAALRNLDVPSTKQDFSSGSFHLAKELDPASRIDLDKEYTARDLLNLLRARTFSSFPACWFVAGEDEFEARITITRKKKV